jgi:hypothetical protein
MKYSCHFKGKSGQNGRVRLARLKDEENEVPTRLTTCPKTRQVKAMPVEDYENCNR